MTTLRQAAQQALEALEFLSLDFFMLGPVSPGREAGNKAIAALRTALAESEPRNQCGETCQRAKLCAVCARGLAEPAQEPTSEAIHAAWSAGYVEGEKAALAEQPVMLEENCLWARNGNQPCPHVQQAEPVHEPVAWAVYDIKHGGSKTLHWPEQHSPNGDPSQFKAVPLYNTAPPQRQWLGLTNEEIEDAIDDGFSSALDNGNVSTNTVIRYVRIIEIKLKEKNT